MRQSRRAAARDGSKSRQHPSYIELQARIGALEADLAEALEQQTATAEVLQVINSSPGDLKPVFDAMLEKARRLCEADFGTFWSCDGRSFQVLASTVGGDIGRTGMPDPGTSGDRLVRGESVVQIADVTKEEAYRAGVARDRTQHAGTRTALAVALRKDDVLIGAITTGRREVRPFTDKQIALLQNFAAQAVIAMENARLLGELRERTRDLEESLEYQTATSDVLQVISRSTFDLKPVLDTVCETAVRLCAADLANISIREGETYRVVSIFAFSPEFDAFARDYRYVPSRGTVSARTALEGRVVHIADVAEDAEYTVPEVLSVGKVRTVLGVPLLREGEPIGVLTLSRQRVEPFTERQIELVRTFADQAVIAIENTRLITETREALEQQTATAEVLQVINSTPGDLAPVFDAMLDKAMALCAASDATLYTLDGERARFAAARGTSGVVEWARQQSVIDPPPGSSIDRLRRGERFVHLLDARETETYRISPVYREMIDVSGCRSSIAVALRREETVIGVIAIYRLEVRPFTDKQIALLENFAAQAVIAIENTRLITETREALEQQTATAEVLQVINSSPGDLAPVFDAILEKAHGLCGIVTGSLQLFDGEYFRAVAVRGAVESLARQLREGYRASDNPITCPLLDGARFVQIPDLDEIDHARVIASIEAIRTRTLLCVPLRKGDALLGTIAAGRLEVQPYSDKEIALIENFAAQAVIAMENARLLGELRQRTEEVAGLNRDLEARVAAQVEELGRVGRLKRFLAPQLAELIVSQGDEKILESHRREIVVVFCDLRGYTAFTETAEPEEVLNFLRQYHGALGPLVSQFEGTLDQFSGDGIMVFFNDPVPCPDPAERAVKMAMAMREEAGKLIATWRRDGCELGFGAGIAQGYATLGQIGFSERSGYTAIGTVCNLAARLCAEAKDGQILIGRRVARAVEAVAKLEDLGNLELRGLRRPVAAFNVVQSIGAADARPNLTVVARGPGA